MNPLEKTTRLYATSTTASKRLPAATTAEHLEMDDAPSPNDDMFDDIAFQSAAVQHIRIDNEPSPDYDDLEDMYPVGSNAEEDDTEAEDAFWAEMTDVPGTGYFESPTESLFREPKSNKPEDIGQFLLDLITRDFIVTYDERVTASPCQKSRREEFSASLVHHFKIRKGDMQAFCLSNASPYSFATARITYKGVGLFERSNSHRSPKASHDIIAPKLHQVLEARLVSAAAILTSQWSAYGAQKMSKSDCQTTGALERSGYGNVKGRKTVLGPSGLFPIMELPGELRNTIYDYIFAPVDIEVSHLQTDFSRAALQVASLKTSLVALMYTNRRLRFEIETMSRSTFASNRFHIRVNALLGCPEYQYDMLEKLDLFTHIGTLVVHDLVKPNMSDDPDEYNLLVRVVQGRSLIVPLSLADLLEVKEYPQEWVIPSSVKSVGMLRTCKDVQVRCSGTSCEIGNKELASLCGNASRILTAQIFEAVFLGPELEQVDLFIRKEPDTG